MFTFFQITKRLLIYPPAILVLRDNHSNYLEREPGNLEENNDKELYYFQTLRFAKDWVLVSHLNILEGKVHNPQHGNNTFQKYPECHKIVS